MIAAQEPVVTLAKLGAMPESRSASTELIGEYKRLIGAIQKPISDDDARVLVTLFGPDDFFELVWPLIHLIETAPNWPLENVLTDQNEWLATLRDRSIRAGLLPSRS